MKYQSKYLVHVKGPEEDWFLVWRQLGDFSLDEFFVHNSEFKEPFYMGYLRITAKWLEVET